MLQGPDKKFYARSQSKKEITQGIAMNRQLSEPQAHLSGGISSRRERRGPQNGNRPPLEEDND